MIFNTLYKEITFLFAEADKSFCPTRVMERGREGGGRWEPEKEVGGGEQPSSSRDPWGRRDEVVVQHCFHIT